MEGFGSPIPAPREEEDAPLVNDDDLQKMMGLVQQLAAALQKDVNMELTQATNTTDSPKPMAPPAALDSPASRTLADGMSTDAPEATGEILSVWATSAMDDVSAGPGKATWGAAPGGLLPVRVAAAGGERVSFQVGVKLFGGSAPSSFSVEFDMPEGADREGHAVKPWDECINLRRLMPPDALVPLEWGVSCSDPTALWVSIDVPRGCPSGFYSFALRVRGTVLSAPAFSSLSIASRLAAASQAAGSIVASSSGDSDALRSGLLWVQGEIDLVCDELRGSNRPPSPEVVTVNLQVRGFQVPVTPSLPVLCGLSEEVLERRWGAERGSPQWRELLSRHSLPLMAKYRMSPYICRWNARGSDMGLVTYTSPWPLGSKEAEEMLRDPRLSVYLLPMPSDKAHAQGADPGTPSTSQLTELQGTTHFKKALFYLFDEPTLLEHYEKLRSWANSLRQQVPSARILTTYYCGPKDGVLPEGSLESFLSVPGHLADCTNVFCTSEWALGEDPRNPQKVLSRIEVAAGGSSEWWSYVCMGPGSPHPNWHMSMTGAQHRAVAWRVWYEGAKGLLYWGANCYDASARSPAEPIAWREGLPEGDGVLMYPGEAYGAGPDPVASVRLERALMGLQDVDYLNMHAEKHGRRATLSVLEGMAYRGPCLYALKWGQAEKLKEELCAGL